VHGARTMTRSRGARGVEARQDPHEPVKGAGRNPAGFPFRTKSRLGGGTFRRRGVRPGGAPTRFAGGPSDRDCNPSPGTGDPP